MDELNASGTFEQLLDDTAPTILDFIDALEGMDAKADALPMVSRVQVMEDIKPKTRTKSNTWRQRQRMEVLRLRDEVKHLDTELKKIKLAAGVRSTVPLIEGVTIIAAAQRKRPAVKKLLGESWQDAASRESLARQIASVDNERLHKVLHTQVKHARKLHRMITQQMTTTVVAQALGCRPAFCGKEGRPPTDNDVVFQKLLAEMDEHRGNVSSIFTSDTTDQKLSKKEGHVSIHCVRGLQVQLVNRYTLPFSVEATERAIWHVLTDKESNDKNSRVAYNELFEFDSSTTLQSVRTFIVAGPYELCFLVRKGCRKYQKGDRMHFVVHETSIVSTRFGAGVSYDEVVWRTVVQGRDRSGIPTAIIETHVLATFPSYKTLNCLPPEGLKGFSDSLMRFNHKTEDVLISNVTS
ncbi:hypothetical protein F441_12846 [Phytophthora nicotianae CJ01A1]|uniref:Uncharacterized protein n=4 Tax=Phytophthora nicotianae TaxID=4792 RepID=W2R562_PHYN3|nr:hypothetical protein PPTG_02975 [Phytophthora nicotianae INRA-310]ETI41935.1 hypothetical protein F443_12879 [Phytophthora nicotianae P1569]ETK81966.1 hypothetical protein L915_12587 [Phytophthora nicotianae]ETP11664.1 hypothetical protein F441_12846 [Phytophthora nicotianae CJ01A1]ETL35372.1 hypothetical protein L916_12496 [Phytophthora nicotianae]ETL88609.1 hypothetical protein L917_12335 [Phytophthora nicotianae]